MSFLLLLKTKIKDGHAGPARFGIDGTARLLYNYAEPVHRGGSRIL